MKRKKKKRTLSLSWALLATAGIFYIFGSYVAPAYEKQFVEAGIFEEVFPVSKVAVSFSFFLLFLFIIAVVFRFIRRKE